MFNCCISTVHHEFLNNTLIGYRSPIQSGLKDNQNPVGEGRDQSAKGIPREDADVVDGEAQTGELLQMCQVRCIILYKHNIILFASHCHCMIHYHRIQVNCIFNCGIDVGSITL